MLATPRIEAIDKKSVHNICSGQVIVTLATAVKELVENAIDAGANSVRVTFREHGLSAIEVSDNGLGINEANFKGLTLKHYTSKIRNFDDISQISTFGFRGEALSSLCALGNLSIVTSVGDVGTALQYGYDGEILLRKSQARPRGTTVVIENLFVTLPVRHKEISKNIKKEFHKAIDVLQAYSMIAYNVRIHCVNVIKKRKQVIFSTNGKSSLRENVIDILGSSIFKNLTPLQFTESMFKVYGFISKPLPKHGRGSADKQYVFINGRPCDHDKVMKIINTNYRQYEKFQYPICVLVIEIEKESVDCNVTPDKRKLFLDNEDILLDKINQYLSEEFEKFAGTYIVQSNTIQMTLPTAAIPNKTSHKDPHFPAHSTSKTSLPTEGGVQDSSSFYMEIVEPKDKEKFEMVIHQTKHNAEVSHHSLANIEKSFVKIVDEKVIVPRKEVPFTMSLSVLRARLKQCKDLSSIKGHTVSVHFKHQIVSNNEAEKELTKTISKPMFRKMRVLGQFNLGFILARLEDNMFIIDQHASDEKFRYEKLQKTTKLEHQKLIHPKLLSLNGAQEDVLINFEHVFNKNGFEFLINENGDIGKRISLSSLPRIQNCEFDESDVEELLWLLTEEASSNIERLRPSKIHRMFASRACRSAVMIGTALGVREMTQIVGHMSDMEHPWNCPHGRPTMRHVVDLSRINCDM